MLDKRLTDHFGILDVIYCLTFGYRAMRELVVLIAYSLLGSFQGCGVVAISILGLHIFAYVLILTDYYIYISLSEPTKATRAERVEYWTRKFSFTFMILVILAAHTFKGNWNCFPDSIFEGNVCCVSLVYCSFRVFCGLVLSVDQVVEKERNQ